MNIKCINIVTECVKDSKKVVNCFAVLIELFLNENKKIMKYFFQTFMRKEYWDISEKIS